MRLLFPAAGLIALVVLVSCGQSEPETSPSPTKFQRAIQDYDEALRRSHISLDALMLTVGLCCS